MEKTKKITVVAVFALMIFGLAISHWLLPDAKLSDTERRALAQKPEFSSEKVFDGSYASELETYLLEQFPLRDSFRGIKTVMNTHLWQMKNTNDYYYADGHWMEMEEKLEEKQVSFAVKRFNEILADHPQIENAYYAIIPDKNYFLADKNGYPVMDYEELYRMMEEVEAQEIDLRQTLSLDDYYRTDSHWRQEKLQKVVTAMNTSMNVPVVDFNSYEQHELEGFSGVYADHTAYPFISESLVYLQNATTENAALKRIDEYSGQWVEMSMYDVEAYEGVDPYDIYLSGAESLITIENPDAKSDKHLIMFRDSFASALTPMLCESYAKITMVDLRYITLEYVDQFVDFENADVLFLYSTTLLNAAGTVLK